MQSSLPIASHSFNRALLLSTNHRCAILSLYKEKTTFAMKLRGNLIVPKGGSLTEEGQLSFFWTLGSPRIFFHTLQVLSIPLDLPAHYPSPIPLSSVSSWIPEGKKNPLQPLCCYSPKAVAFVHSVLWPCIPVLAVLQIPSLEGQRGWRLSCRGAAMPQELKQWLFSMVHGSRSAAASQHGWYGAQGGQECIITVYSVYQWFALCNGLKIYLATV